jgi:hypothetical protein
LSRANRSLKLKALQQRLPRSHPSNGGAAK